MIGSPSGVEGRDPSHGSDSTGAPSYSVCRASSVTALICRWFGGSPGAAISMCNGTTATGDATCNNIDDDCDGKFDEDYDCDLDNDGQCDSCGQGQLCNGHKACENGVEVCKGDPILPEVCNCLDDDCDGNVEGSGA